MRLLIRSLPYSFFFLQQVILNIKLYLVVFSYVCYTWLQIYFGHDIVFGSLFIYLIFFFFFFFAINNFGHDIVCASLSIYLFCLTINYFEHDPFCYAIYGLYHGYHSSIENRRDARILFSYFYL